MKKESASPLLVVLVSIFCASLLIANILANRMFEVFGISMDCGTLLFPLTYVLSDVFSEVYGYRWSRRVSWIASACNILMVAMIFISNVLPAPEWYDPTPFSLALSLSGRIVAASLISFQLGDFVNDRVFDYIRSKNSSASWFKVRAAGSSLAGEVVDTTSFVVIAYLGTMPNSELVPMIVLSVVIKTAYEIAILPVTCLLVRKVRALEG